MPPTKKYLDFVASEPFERVSKHGGSDTRRSYVAFTCPHCDTAFVEIAADSLHTNKASECLKHLRVCDAAKAAGVLVPPAKKKRTVAEEPPPVAAEEAAQQAQCALAAERARSTALAASEAKLAGANEQLRARVHSVESELAGLRAELERMQLRMTERDARDRERDALLRACTDSLGLTTPPLPAAHTIAEKIAGLQKAARVARSAPPPPPPPPPPNRGDAHALRQRHAREMEGLKQAHNDLLLDALRKNNAGALATATKAVRRELCLLVHPDKAGRFESARQMGETVMQRLGELAQ